ncbi:ATP-binding cassette subfamily G member 4-like [Rhynchophorus ferrugineus]|uniref:ATP-binding cassette subfamily G member 4-like n=1 Tax=Rhynchophorus ferrugineus TaxID=354439 RepID=UPI003FCD975E
MAERAEEERVPLRCDVPLKQLNRIAKRAPVDIDFQDLTYSIRDSYTGKGWRQLLKSINGSFRSGELTAIMGPSGAGKSTLLNILAGYVTAGVKGSIRAEGRPRDLTTFKKLSAYIMQDDIVQPRLTVCEAVMFAARLKLGSEIQKSEKHEVVEEVIQLLGLEKCMNTRTEYLSGGQRKRLTVALELVNNPPVIFLDEPTTGLDNVAIKQCIELLHKITKHGRTVICTIHQPPASLFHYFDQVYVLAQGYCVFNGSPSQLVPFLSKASLPCPPTYTPADYIIELVQSKTDNITALSNTIQNGKINLIEKKKEETIICTKTAGIFEIQQDYTQTVTKNYDVFPISIWMQLVILLHRNFLQLKRNHSNIYIQFFHHLASGLLVGSIFFALGNDGSQTLSVFKYILSVNVFFMYTYVMVPVLTFPLEVRLMKREYFNRWYSLKAYYMCFTLSALPLMTVLSIMFLIIVYLLSSQPMDLDRFIWFSTLALAVGFCSQGLGYVIGSTFNITNGSVVGSSALAPLLALACYGMGYRSTIEPVMKVIMGLSYLRYGVVGLTITIFANREPMDCDEYYCHYRDPDLLLRDMGMLDENRPIQLYALIAFTVFFRILAYCTLKFQLTSELKNQIVYLAAKIVRQKD